MRTRLHARFPCSTTTSTYQPGRKGAAPFVHDTDPRLYRPTVPLRGTLSVEVPATPSSRTHVPRDVEVSGCKGKLVAMQEASRCSHLQMLHNVETSRRSGIIIYTPQKDQLCNKSTLPFFSCCWWLFTAPLLLSKEQQGKKCEGKKTNAHWVFFNIGT